MVIGVANYQNGESLDTLVARVDEALDDAKQKGKNRIEFR